MGLIDGTTQWPERDFWSKYGTSFYNRIGSNKFKVGAFKYNIDGLIKTVHIVLFKVSYGYKRGYYRVMKDFKKAVE